MNNQEKRKLFQEHLKEQQRQRQIQQQKKKQAESLKNNQEDMLFIQKEFRVLAQEMQGLTGALKNKQVTLPQLFAHYNKMKNYYLQINYVLTTYDRQYYKELLEKTNTNLLQLKKKLQPKKKFKFSRRDEDFGVKDNQKAQEFKHIENKGIQISGLQNKSNQKIIITKECVEGGSYKIVNCQKLQVEILQKTEILFLKNLKDCVIKCAVTKSTVFVDHCVNCVFELNCHQLRIHNTFDSRFNIFVTSKAIIEDCNKVIFSPYTFNYSERSRHELEEQKNEKPNLWREIQDFNWLKQNQKSPHFQLIQH